MNISGPALLPGKWWRVVLEKIQLPQLAGLVDDSTPSVHVLAFRRCAVDFIHGPDDTCAGFIITHETGLMALRLYRIVFRLIVERQFNPARFQFGCKVAGGGLGRVHVRSVIYYFGIRKVIFYRSAWRSRA